MFSKVKKIYVFAYLQLLCLFLTSNPVAAKRIVIQADRKQENSFSKITFQNKNIIINDYRIKHQGLNTIDLIVNYQLTKTSTSIENIEKYLIYQKLNQLMINYPNETDMWEILNCHLTENLVELEPNLLSVTLTVAVHPNSEYPYYRSSTVTQTSEGSRWESWHFDFRSTRIMKKMGNQFINSKINVDYTYKSHISNTEYPDFIPIYKQIDSFLSRNLYRYSSWELIKQQLQQNILRENPSLSSISLELEKLR